MLKVFKSFSACIAMSITIVLQSCFLIEDNIDSICTSNCITIEGRFTTDDGETPIKNVQLEFDWGTQPSPGLGLGGETRNIAITKTNKNGYYRIVFYAKDKELTSGSFSVEFKVSDSEYIIDQDYAYFELFGIRKRDTLITRNYHIPRRGAKINLRIKNPEDINGDDRVICQVTYKYDNGIHHGAGDLFSFHSTDVIIPTAANQYSYIRTSKRINGEYFDFLDSVKVSVNETRVYEVVF